MKKKAVKVKSKKQVLKKVKLNGTRFSLKRNGDNIGDSGAILLSYKVPTKAGMSAEDLQAGVNGEVRVGCRILCGSNYARSYQYQDYWLTTAVVKILAVNKNKTKVKFATLNSVYTVEVI